MIISGSNRPNDRTHPKAHQPKCIYVARGPPAQPFPIFGPVLNHRIIPALCSPSVLVRFEAKLGHITNQGKSKVAENRTQAVT
jgi:hypothetical protein